MGELGLKHASAVSRACGLPDVRVRNFLAGQIDLLTKETLTALAAWRIVSVADLKALQGGLTAEDFKRELNRWKMNRLHAEHPAGSPERAEWAAKGAAAQRGKPLSATRIAQNGRWREDATKVKAAGRAQSFAAISLRAADQTRPSWQRWAAERMLALDLTYGDLMSRWGITRSSVDGLFEKPKDAPGPINVRRLEEALGPMPTEALRKIISLRSKRAGGLKSQQLLRDRVRHWSREKLEAELLKLGDDVLADRRDSLKELPWGTPLRKRGYEIYMRARAYKMRSALPVPRKISRSKNIRHILSYEGEILRIVSGLKRRSRSPFYQCQNCGQLWMKNAISKRGALCDPCWRVHLPRENAWRMGGQNGSRPVMPKRRGALIGERELQERIVGVLLHAIGRLKLGALPADADTTRRLARTRERLQESAHPWCQRVKALLDNHALAS